MSADYVNNVDFLPSGDIITAVGHGGFRVYNQQTGQEIQHIWYV
jgi:hypothetical protein